MSMRSTSSHPFSENLSVSSNHSAGLSDDPRAETDSCPGAVRMFQAQDGLIGRIRFPGGRVRAHQWEQLAELSDNFGDGSIHLTSRGNLQLRGISDHAGFVAQIIECGLLPSPEHDVVRNILCSPLALDLLDLVSGLDDAIIASEAVKGCSGRTLFGIDSGDGLIIAQHPDFGVLENDGVFHLFLAGVPTGVAIERENVAAAMVKAAEVWQSLRGTAWRVKEKPELIPEIVTSLEQLSFAVAAISPPEASGLPAPIGWIPQGDKVSLGAGVRLGQLSSQLARFLAAIDVDTSVTPWNSLVVHGLSEGAAEQVVKVLAPMGLIFDDQSPWLKATACIGSPGCAKSHANVRLDLDSALSSGQLDVSQPVHFVGCQRRCGHPMHPHVEYQATPESDYEVIER